MKVQIRIAIKGSTKKEVVFSFIYSKEHRYGKFLNLIAMK